MLDKQCFFFWGGGGEVHYGTFGRGNKRFTHGLWCYSLLFSKVLLYGLGSPHVQFQSRTDYHMTIFFRSIGYHIFQGMGLRSGSGAPLLRLLEYFKVC